VSGPLHIQRAGGKEFQISGAATLKMQTTETGWLRLYIPLDIK